MSHFELLILSGWTLQLVFLTISFQLTDLNSLLRNNSQLLFQKPTQGWVTRHHVFNLYWSTCIFPLEAVSIILKLLNTFHKSAVTLLPGPTWKLSASLSAMPPKSPGNQSIPLSVPWRCWTVQMSWKHVQPACEFLKTLPKWIHVVWFVSWIAKKGE